jgi:hypothetical protein
LVVYLELAGLVLLLDPEQAPAKAAQMAGMVVMEVYLRLVPVPNLVIVLQ